MPDQDAEPMALAWIEVLNQHNIPYAHYETLYRRSIQLRARRLENGMKCDDFSVEMMVACWPSLSAELHRAAVESGRYLPDVAASDCDRCFGTGVETVAGKGARRCDHAKDGGV